MNVMDYSKNPFFSFFYKEIVNRRTISQGFLVETNDMHGKIRSQASYSERDEITPLSASYYTYRNTGKNGLNDKVNFVYNDEAGAVHSGNIGVDMELMSDVREFSVKSNGFNGQLQVDIYTIAAAQIPLPTFFPLKTYVENKYRAVTCTKLINYHAIEDSVIVMDKGSVISTKTLAYDAETGGAIVTKTANEFNDTVYNVNYPAYWAYSSTGLAYKNINREYMNLSFSDGKITDDGIAQDSVFESGDELYISKGSGSPSCVPESGDVARIWAFDKNKNSTPLSVVHKDIIFMDSSGVPFTKAGVNCRIIRSGKRNNLGLNVASATCMVNPIKNVGGVLKLRVDSTSKVVNVSAIDYKEKWQSDNDAIDRKVYYSDTCFDDPLDSFSCNGILIKNINPYVKGLVGNLKPYRSYTFYGERMEYNPAVATAIRKNGFIKSYADFWAFDENNNLVPDYANIKWAWNSELTKVNSKGQELETKDALNRYTAGQYGFNKSLPLGMTQNARYGESFNEGFEDYYYKEQLNKLSPHICADRYIDFSGLANTSIVDLMDSSFQAHSGRYALKVNSATTVNKQLPVGKIVDSLNLKTSPGILINAGIGPAQLVSRWTEDPNLTGSTITALTTRNSSNLGFSTHQNWGGNIGWENLKFHEKDVQYTKVETGGNYTFHLKTLISTVPLGSSAPADDLKSRIYIKITNLRNGQTHDMDANFCMQACTNNNPDEYYTVFLECGMHKIEINLDATFYNAYTNDMYTQFSYNCFGLTSYEAVTCNYTKPI